MGGGPSREPSSPITRSHASPTPAAAAAAARASAASAGVAPWGCGRPLLGVQADVKVRQHCPHHRHTPAARVGRRGGVNIPNPSHARTRAHTPSCACTHPHTGAHTQRGIHTRTDMHTHARTHVHARARTHTHTHANTPFSHFLSFANPFRQLNC